MAGNHRWTGRWQRVITTGFDNAQYINVSPCCGVDSKGGAWIPVCKMNGDVFELHFYHAHADSVLEPSAWASKAYVPFEYLVEYDRTSGPGPYLPCMLVDENDNLLAWWHRAFLWQSGNQTTDVLQGLKGSIDPDTGALTLDQPIDLGIPYVEGFGPDYALLFNGLETDPDGYLWLVTNPMVYVEQPHAGLLYGDDLEVGTYRYALSYQSSSSELGCGYYSEVTTLAAAAVPSAPSNFSAPNPGGFGVGTHWFRVTFYKEDGTSGDGETTAGPAASYSLAAGSRSICMRIPRALGNGGRRVYYSTSQNGSYYLVYTQADCTTQDIEVPAPAFSGASPPATNTLPAKRVAVVGWRQGPPGTTARRIYRTQVGGSTYGLVGTVTGNSADWGWLDDTDDSIGTPPPYNPANLPYLCLVAGRSNAARSWASGVTWETVCGWHPGVSLGYSVGIAGLGGGLAVVVGGGTSDNLSAWRRTTGGVWGPETTLVPSVPSNQWITLGALTVTSDGVRLGYLWADQLTPHDQWYYAPLSVSDEGVSMGTPVNAGSGWDYSENAPRLSWDEDLGELVMHGGGFNDSCHVFNAIEGEPESGGEDLSTTGADVYLLAAPRRTRGAPLWEVFTDWNEQQGIVLWTPTKEDPPDCDEDECPKEDEPPCGPGRSEMNSAWMGDSGGPSGGSPSSGFSGYVGGRPASRWVGSAIDLSEVTRLRASDASGDVALSHPTSAVQLRFAGGQSGSRPMGRNWSHEFNLTLVQQGENTVDIQHEGGRWDRYRFADSVWSAEDGRRASLAKNGDGSWSETTPYGVVYNFPPTGSAYPSTVRVASIVDANSNRTTFSYADGNLQSVQDAFSQTVTFSYNADGRVLDVTDPSGARTTFSYENMDLRSVFHPDGTRVTYSYRASHDPVSIGNALGEVTTLSYDAHERLRTVANPAGQLVRTITYDATARRAVVTDARGGVWTSTYSETGRPLTRQDPLGRTRQNSLESGFDATAFIDARGNRWTYTYDSLHRRTGMTSPLLCVHSYEYNADNMPIVYVDSLGNRTTSVYDSHRNRVAEVHPDGGVVSYSYYPDAPYGRLRDVQDARGSYTTYTYDARGNLETTLRPDDTVVTFTYSARNQLESTTDPLGHTVTNSYDVMGRLTEVRDPLGNRTTYVYDLLGRQIAVVDPLGNRTTTQYNALGQVEAQVDALGNRVSYSYDSNGNRVTTMDPLGKLTTFLYDARDRLVSGVSPLGLTTSYDYDENGNQRAVIDALGKRTTTSYDAVNRPTAVSDPLNHSVGTVYYTTGWVKATVDQLGNRTTYSYDGMGRQREALDALGNRTTYSYDLGGNQVEMQDARGNRWTSIYNCMNRLTASIDPSGASTTHSYDLAGRRIATLHAGGGRTSYSYDAASRQIAVSRDEG